MPSLITRRTVLTTSAIILPALLGSRASAGSSRTIEQRLEDVEVRSRGRLGVAILDTASGKLVGNRIDERFPMCSTFKALAVAFVLARVDRGDERLDRRIVFTEHDLVTPSIATQPHVGPGGMTIAELCDAAITVSDSTAANLLLASFGGPSALTAYLRSLGDPVTRLDRIELDLNIVKPGDQRDTTSPATMVRTLQRLLLGDALSDASRTRLIGWMVGARDAATARLRVGLPQGWRIANKPGTWKGITTNDVGVIWPPGRAPIVVAAYLAEAPTPVATQEAILSEIGRIVADNI